MHLTLSSTTRHRLCKHFLSVLVARSNTSSMWLTSSHLAYMSTSVLVKNTSDSIPPRVLMACPCVCIPRSAITTCPLTPRLSSYTHQPADQAHRTASRTPWLVSTSPQQCTRQERCSRRCCSWWTFHRTDCGYPGTGQTRCSTRPVRRT
jgi:hypothetical protein